MLASISGWAQENVKTFALPDSLAIKLENSEGNDLKRIEALSEVNRFYTISRHYVESRPYVEEMAKLADKLKDPYYKASSDLSMAILAEELDDDNPKGLNYCNSAYIIASQLPETTRNIDLRVRIYNTLGVSYSNAGIESEAYECYIKGLELNEKINNKTNESILKVNLLTTYNAMKKYNESIAMGKELVASKDYVYDRFVPYCCIGADYKDLGKYDTALMYYDTAYSYAFSERDKILCLANIGLIHFSKGDYELAEKDFNRCLNDFSIDAPKNVEITAWIYLACLNDMKSKNDKAMVLIDKAIENARTENLSDLELAGLSWKSEFLYSKKDLEGYYQCISRFFNLSDSITKVNQSAKMEALWLQQEFKKTETQLQYEKQISDHKHHKQKQSLILIISLLVLGVIIMILMLNQKKLMLKNKNVDLKNKELKEKALTQELDLRNREMTARTLVQTQRQELLNEIITKLKSISGEKNSISSSISDVIKDFEQYKNVSNPEEFDYYFTQTHPDFYEHLRADFPDLTPNELRLCAYLKMNMNTKDIATISNITPESARVARARLRKSLKITDSSQDLAVFISKY